MRHRKKWKLPWLMVVLLPLLLAARPSADDGAAGQSSKPENSATAPSEPKPSAGLSQSVDAETCKTCHEDVVNEFVKTRHGKADKFHAFDFTQSCGSCHTNAAEHAETGDPSKVGNLAKLSLSASSETCLGCHENQHEQSFWRGSEHETSELGCLSCHSVHKAKSPEKLLIRRTEKETCLSCHTQQQRAQFQRSTHLFMDEHRKTLIGCSTCHNPHGTETPKMIKALSVNDLCYQCHTEKRGPFLWQHPPVQENCLNCHTQHGSNNASLLKMRGQNLCQSCHMQGRHQTVAGSSNTMWNINRPCATCHSQVHGSNHPSGVKLQR